MELDELLTHAVKRQASDLHLKADAHPVLRIHGHLEVQDDLPPSPASSCGAPRCACWARIDTTV